MRSKLFISYLCLILIPFLIFAIINTHITSKDLETKAIHSSRQVFEQGRSYLEYKIDMEKTYMNVLSMNDKIQEIIKKDSAAYNDNAGIWGFDLAQIRKQFFNAKPDISIAQTRIYLNGSLTNIDETEDVQKLSRVLKTNWYNQLVTTTNSFVWFYDEEKGEDNEPSKYISSVRRIPDNENFKEIIGVVRVDIPESVFKSILDHVTFFNSASVFLVNNYNEILCTSSSANTTATSFIYEIIKGYSKDNLSSGVWDNFTINNANYLVGMQNVAGTNWNMVVAIPYKEILSSQSKTLKQMLIIILVIAPLSFPLAYFGAASGTRRIRKLIANIRIIQKGDFNVSVLQGGKDEIGELTSNFNIMITKIAMLLDEKYELGREIKSMELKALQAQINPHFLYNTLDLIYWKAMRIKENSIYELVKSLSKFYKLSLSKGKDIVLLENEIEHVKAYVQIQNARFKNGITLIVDIPESLYQKKIPKITLQPIVENSIIHGILETKDEKGIIKISGYCSEGKFILEIEDDGVGISKEKLANILVENSSDTFHGYGINNINKRIKLLYGDDYGLEYTSKAGLGTTVRIIFPDL